MKNKFTIQEKREENKMAVILFTMLALVIYMMFILKSKDEKKDMMCLEKCNMKDCNHCIDKEQCK